jgi:hypothetical protein
MKTYGILRLHKLNIVKITEQFTHRKIENCEILRKHTEYYAYVKVRRNATKTYRVLRLRKITYREITEYSAL